jgi:hypothetical protein
MPAVNCTVYIYVSILFSTIPFFNSFHILIVKYQLSLYSCCQLDFHSYCHLCLCIFLFLWSLHSFCVSCFDIFGVSSVQIPVVYSAFRLTTLSLFHADNSTVSNFPAENRADSVLFIFLIGSTDNCVYSPMVISCVHISNCNCVYNACCQLTVAVVSCFMVPVDCYIYIAVCR